MKTKLGQVISVPVLGVNSNQNLHCFRVDVEVFDRELDPILNDLHTFWETENVGCEKCFHVRQRPTVSP